MEATDVFTMLKGFGASGPFLGFLFYLWYRADTKLEKLQNRYADSMDAGNTSRVDLATALNRLADKITGAH